MRGIWTVSLLVVVASGCILPVTETPDGSEPQPLGAWMPGPGVPPGFQVWANRSSESYLLVQYSLAQREEHPGGICGMSLPFLVHYDFERHAMVAAPYNQSGIPAHRDIQAVVEISFTSDPSGCGAPWLCFLSSDGTCQDQSVFSQVMLLDIDEFGTVHIQGGQLPGDRASALRVPRGPALGPGESAELTANYTLTCEPEACGSRTVSNMSRTIVVKNLGWWPKSSLQIVPSSEFCQESYRDGEVEWSGPGCQHGADV